jgi:hypothetical protein
MVPFQVVYSAIPKSARLIMLLVNLYGIVQCRILNVNIITGSSPAARNAKAPSVIQFQEGLPALVVARVSSTRVLPPMGGTVINGRLTHGSSFVKEDIVEYDCRGSAELDNSRNPFKRYTWADGSGHVMRHISVGPLIRYVTCNANRRRSKGVVLFEAYKVPEFRIASSTSHHLISRSAICFENRRWGILSRRLHQHCSPSMFNQDYILINLVSNFNSNCRVRKVEKAVTGCG